MLNKPILDQSRIFPRIREGQKEADMLPPDYLAVASVLLSLGAIYAGYRFFAWCACFALISTLLTRNRTEFDKYQTIISSGVALVVLFLMYSDPYFGESPAE
jgi:hypothetical protein